MRALISFSVLKYHELWRNEFYWLRVNCAKSTTTVFSKPHSSGYWAHNVVSVLKQILRQFPKSRCRSICSQLNPKTIGRSLPIISKHLHWSCMKYEWMIWLWLRVFVIYFYYFKQKRYCLKKLKGKYEVFVWAISFGIHREFEKSDMGWYLKEKRGEGEGGCRLTFHSEIFLLSPNGTSSPA